MCGSQTHTNNSLVTGNVLFCKLLNCSRVICSVITSSKFSLPSHMPHRRRKKKKIFSLLVNQHNMNPTSTAKDNQKCLWMPSVAKEVTTGSVMLHNTFEKGGHMWTGRRGRGKRAGAGTTWITALRMQSTDGEEARARSRSDPGAKMPVGGATGVHARADSEGDRRYVWSAVGKPA